MKVGCFHLQFILILSTIDQALVMASRLDLTSPGQRLKRALRVHLNKLLRGLRRRWPDTLIASRDFEFVETCRVDGVPSTQVYTQFVPNLPQAVSDILTNIITIARSVIFNMGLGTNYQYRWITSNI